jgi:PST family polysaccharide transporter
VTNTANTPPAGPVDAPQPGDLAQRVGAGMVWGQVGRIAELALATAIAVLVVRALEPHGFGTYSLLTNLAGAASIFIPVVGTEALGAVLPRLPGSGERLWLATLVGTLRLAAIGAVGLVVVPLWGVVAETFGVSFVSVQVLVVTFVYWAGQDLLNTVAGLYAAELDLRPVALWRAAGQATTFAGLGAVELLGDLSVGRTIALVALGYVVAAGALAVRLRTVAPSRPGSGMVRFALRLTPNVWLIGVLTYLVATHVGVLVLGAVTASPAEVAFYSAAIGIVGRAQLVFVSGWISVMVPTLGAVRAQGGVAAAKLVAMRFAELWLLVALPLNLLLVALAAPLVELLFGAAYEPAGRLLAWYAALSAITALVGGPIGTATMWALDRQHVLMRVRLGVAVVNVGLAVLLVHELEGLGAVIAVAVAAIATAAVEFGLAARAGAVVYPVALAARATGAAGVAAAAAFAAAAISPAPIATGAVAGVALYVAALRALRPFGPDHLELLGRISPRLARSPLRSFARS